MTIQERIAKVEEEFSQVDKAIKETQDSLMKLQTRAVELRGAYQMLQELAAAEAVEAPVSVEELTEAPKEATESATEEVVSE